ncbi:MAG: hypothetical protein FWD26_02425 [Treponema sp.]|nr:hypothetical protein [Treponema sp.]
MEKTQTLPDYPRGLTFEHVWAALMETRKLQEENVLAQREMQREMRIDFDRQNKEYNKRFGEINNRFSEAVEYMVSPNLLDKFNNLGLDFQTASTNFKVRDHKNKIYFEIDVFLQNGDVAMLVEVKTNLSIRYINEHINRLEKMRAYADLHGDKRYFLGAVAGIIIPSEVKQYALDNGLYLIEPSGETFNLISPNDKPKEW